MKPSSFLLIIITILGLSCRQESHPDWILHHAVVLTVDDGFSIAEAIAISGDTIVAVGANAEIMALAGPRTKMTDMEGKTVVPGFIDAHCHPRPVYPFQSIHGQVDVTPNNTPTMEALVQELQRKAAITPDSVWIFGGRYQDTKLGRHPNRYDLDQASTAHPISLQHSSGHISVVNSKALHLAGVTASTPDPPGGSFDRDPDGTPNGVCRESAYQYVMNRAPKPAKPSWEEQKDGLRRKLVAYAAKGITSLADAGVDLEKFRLYEALASEGLPVRIQAMLREYVLDTALMLGLTPGYGDERLRINAIKFYHGNSLSGQTCWLYEPYDKINPSTGQKDYYGIPPARSQAELDSLVAIIHQSGYQAAIHANGDREIDMVLDAIEKNLDRSPRADHRHRIEHGSVANENIIRRMKALGIVFAPHSYIYEHGDKMKVYGSARWDWMHANKSALDMGVPVAGNSDEPVSAAHPMLRIQSMVTRTTAEGEAFGLKQRVSVAEALRIWTMGSAFALFVEDRAGSIEVGKLADFVVLDRNPLEADPFTIKDIRVLGTAMGGKWVYQDQMLKEPGR